MSTGRSDPLYRLPPELALRILNLLETTALANLTRASQAWHAFIDGSTNQDTIYYEKTKHTGTRTFDLRSHSSGSSRAFTNYFANVQSFGWKEVCKRQTLLHRNWRGGLKDAGGVPITRTSLMSVGQVWRFRPDFERRFVMSTSENGGLRVEDMDNGYLLWKKPSSEVKRFAHLEYSKGWAAWDRWGNAIEVWRAKDGSPEDRGHFEQIAILPHERQTRGFHLRYPNLCVVSTQGEGYVYDLTTGRPRLQTTVTLPDNAVGHLDQDEQVVLFSMGQAGYHFNSKTSGAFLGIFNPSDIPEIKRFHLNYPNLTKPRESTGSNLLTNPAILPNPPAQASLDRLVPLTLQPGPRSNTHDHHDLALDEWGAGMVSGKIAVGVSRYGRLFICSDWPGALRSSYCAQATTATIEFAPDQTSFDFGGWLSIDSGRVLFEVRQAIHLLTLPEDFGEPDCLLPVTGPRQPRIFATSNSSPGHGLPKPVSWMGLFDDCIMSTHTVVQELLNFPAHDHLLDKVVRVLSFAPDAEANGDAVRDLEKGTLEEESRWGPGYAYDKNDLVNSGDGDFHSASLPRGVSFPGFIGRILGQGPGPYL